MPRRKNDRAAPATRDEIRKRESNGQKTKIYNEKETIDKMYAGKRVIEQPIKRVLKNETLKSYPPREKRWQKQDKSKMNDKKYTKKALFVAHFNQK
jgi:hypothetical protein